MPLISCWLLKYLPPIFESGFLFLQTTSEKYKWFNNIYGSSSTPLHTRATSMNWTGGTRNWFANFSRDDMRRLRSTPQPQRHLVLEDVLSEEVATVDVHAAASEPASSQTDLASLTRVLSRFCCSPTIVT